MIFIISSNFYKVEFRVCIYGASAERIGRRSKLHRAKTHLRSGQISNTAAINREICLAVRVVTSRKGLSEAAPNCAVFTSPEIRIRNS